MTDDIPYSKNYRVCYFVSRARWPALSSGGSVLGKGADSAGAGGGSPFSSPSAILNADIRTNNVRMRDAYAKVRTKYVYVYVCVYMCEYVCVHVSVSVCIYFNICLCVCVYKGARALNLYIHL